MAKKVFLLIVILGIASLFFIPATIEKTITIKSPFLNLYTFVSSPVKWERWRPEFRDEFYADSTKIDLTKKQAEFILKYNGLQLDVRSRGSYFDIEEQDGDKTSQYAWLLTPDKKPTLTQVTAYAPTNAMGYLLSLFRGNELNSTHIDQLKNFIETDSLYYGFKIFKTGVPTGFLIVTQRKVVKDSCFKTAAELVTKLKSFIISRKVTKMQPLIAQFTPVGQDSMAVKVGFFIDKEVTPGDGVQFNRMPLGGPLYAVKYSGRFDKRQRAYDAMQQFFTDRSYQSPIAPFEMYLDDRLPKSDTDKVLVRLNFAGFF